MTEYDYSPEAVDAYLRKQQQISRWVDNTNSTPLRNPNTPATPAAAFARRNLQDDQDDGPHRRRGSTDRRDRHRERDREWARERDREQERELARDRDRDMRPSKPHTKRHRSASHSGPTPARPDAQRSYTVPPPLPIPPYPQQYASGYTGYPSAVPPKLTSPRDSRHSSRSSSTTRIPQVPSPTSYFPQQQPPYSAPAYLPGTMRPPVRSQTSPAYYPYDAKYPPSSSASSPYFHPNLSGYPNMSPPQKQYDWAAAPQYPHSMYQPNKPPPLLKRIFMSITGNNKQNSKKTRMRGGSF